MNNCLSEQVLQDYALNRLAQETVQGVETHLDHCDSCCVVLSRLIEAMSATDPSSAVDHGEMDPATSSAGGAPAFSYWKSSRRPGLETGTCPELPPTLGRYTVEKVLGEGGFGRVVAATDQLLGRRVAIKVPHTTPKDQQHLKMVIAEASTIAGLDHPHIVPIYDVGTTEDIPIYLVSKFIDGQNLAERMLADLRPQDALNWIIQIADALAYAHSKGFLHRDVKPQNILIEENGVACLTDFGLAQNLKDAAGSSRRSGTPAYMSPEQISGSESLDERSDVYSLGKTLAELFNVGQPNGRYQTLATDLQKELASICSKATDGHPEKRFQSASELAAALRKLRVKAGWHADSRLGFAGLWAFWPIRLGLAGIAMVSIAMTFGLFYYASIQKQQREAVLIEDFFDSSIAGLPAHLDKLRDLGPSGIKLLQSNASSSEEQRQRRARAALLHYDPELLETVLDDLLDSKPEHVTELFHAMEPYKARLALDLWQVLVDQTEDSRRRLNAAAYLAFADSVNPHWIQGSADTVVELLLSEHVDSSHFYAPVFRPIFSHLESALHRQIQGNEVPINPTTMKVFECWLGLAGDNIEANLELLVECPVELAPAVITRFKNRERLTTFLKNTCVSEVQDPQSPLAARHYRRHFLAAYSLLLLGEPEEFWNMFQHSAQPDLATTANYLVGDSPITFDLILRRLEESSDLKPQLRRASDLQQRLHSREYSQRRLLLLTLFRSGGWYTMDADRREKLLTRVKELVVDEADSGMYAVGTWLLKNLASWDHWPTEDWGPKADFANGKSARDWTINSLSMRMIEVVDAPGVGHNFCLSQCEVEHRLFLQFVADTAYPWQGKMPTFENVSASEAILLPQTSVTWYDCAAFCNWLSRKEGLEECYEPNESGEFAQGMRLKQNAIALNGYRLPLSLEWEIACRAGADTRYASGNLERYQCAFGWTTMIAHELHAAGYLPPNALGLLDMHGNAAEWLLDRENEKQLEARVMDLDSGITRGGSFRSNPIDTACDHIETQPINTRSDTTGFRVARTIPTHAAAMSAP